MARRAKTAKTEGITDGPISPTLFKLAWPIVFGMFLQTIYNVTDTFWLGRVGDHAVAAISVSFPVIILFISIGAGLTIAGTALVAQYIGAENRKKANFIASQTAGSVCAVAILLAIIGYFLSPHIIALLGPEPDVFADASAYLRTWFLGIPFIFGFLVFQNLVKGYGDTITPMKLMLVSVVANIALDPFLIFGWGPFPELGVQGAAVATVLTRGLASLLGASLLLTGVLGLKVTPKNMIPDLQTTKTIMIIGVPAAGEISMKAVGMMIMTATVAAFGTPTLAAFGVGNRFTSMVFLPSMGLGQATTAMVGQNLGANKEDRAEKATYVASGVALSLLTLFGLLSFVFSDTVAGIFLPGQEDALLLTSQYISLIAFSFGFLGVMNVACGAFRGAGRTVTSMTFAVLSMVGLRVPLAYLLSNHTVLAADGLWWGVSIANTLGGIGAFWWFTRGRWKTRIIEEESTATGPSPSEEADEYRGWRRDAPRSEPVGTYDRE